MNVHIIEQRLASRTVHSAEEEVHALCEITQELVRASLGRSDFFPLHPFKVVRACVYSTALTASVKIWIFPSV